MNKITNNLIKVALYIRVSTDRQVKEGDSLEAQEKALRDYAKEHNYIIVDTYIDGGESGQKIKRTNLQRMLKDVEDNKIDLVIMTKLDRWFRSVADFYKVIEVLRRNKVDWKTIWEDYDTTTASGEFWLNMSLALGQMEAKRTGERINSVFEHKFKVQKTVCSGSHIYGYDITKEKKLAINNQEAEILDKLYDKYLETNSLNETTKWFQANVSPIHCRSIKNYLTNTAYIGKYKHTIEKTKEFEYIDDFSPPIIAIDKFNKVQEMLKVNLKKYQRDSECKNGNKYDYIFSGLIVCDLCGRKMSGKHSKNNHYYICKKAKTTLCNNHTHFSEKKLEEYLINEIKDVIEDEIKKYKTENYIDKDNQMDITKQIAKCKSKMNKLTNLYVEELVDIDYYKSEYTKLKNELDELEEQDQKEEKKDFTKLQEFLNNSEWLTMYDSLSNKDKRMFWMSIIDKVIVQSKDDYEICLKLY